MGLQTADTAFHRALCQSQRQRGASAICGRCCPGSSPSLSACQPSASRCRISSTSTASCCAVSRPATSTAMTKALDEHINVHEPRRRLTWPSLLDAPSATAADSTCRLLVRPRQESAWRSHRADRRCRPSASRRIEAAPLFGESPKGGWSAEIKPEDSIHAIIAVHTDAGHHRLWQRRSPTVAWSRPA